MPGGLWLVSFADAFLEARVDVLEAGLKFAFGRISTHGQFPAETHATLERRAAFACQPARKIFGAGANKRVIEEREGLRSHRGIFAPAATGLGVGTIESLHERLLHDSLMKKVNGAPMRGGRIFQIFWVWIPHIARLDSFGCNGRFDGRPQHLVVQRSAHGENRIAEDFGFQA